jgi:hypothetical protein
MELRFVARDLRELDDAAAELLCCSIWSDERPVRGLAGLVDWRLAGRLSALARDAFFEGAAGDALLVPARPRMPFEKVLVLGLGARAAFDEAAFGSAIDRLFRTLVNMHVRRAVVELPGRGSDAIAPERAAFLLLERAGDSPDHDAWWLVEDTPAQKAITAKTLEERRRTRREP